MLVLKDQIVGLAEMPYGSNVFSCQVFDDIIENLAPEGTLGQLNPSPDHIVHFKDVSHKATNIQRLGNMLLADIVVLQTPCGKILEQLHRDGVRLTFTINGIAVGEKNEDGRLVVEKYNLRSIDVVGPN